MRSLKSVSSDDSDGTQLVLGHRPLSQPKIRLH